MADAAHNPQPEGATGLILFADGTLVWGEGFGAEGSAAGELCFNTAMTGYQEIMTDPSYAGQVICFTFPHIGNVGTNAEDVEADVPHARGCIVRERVTAPSNFRNGERFDDWMARIGQIGIAGVDTRALTRRVRTMGAPDIVIAHNSEGRFDLGALRAQLQAFPGLEGLDLAKEVTRAQQDMWTGGAWTLDAGYQTPIASDASSPFVSSEVETGDAGRSAARPSTALGTNGEEERPHVVAVDYGAKHNIFRNLVQAGARVTVVPAETSAADILALQPAGVFLSNGPGDPAATGDYAVPVIRELLDKEVPIFGICLGHQLLALAIGGRTLKMEQGHRGANHPVKRLADNVVEITSMNHGFAVDATSLPETARVTHVSLFDGSNCGFELTDKKAFSVQYHPEASPGPQDSLYLFEKFVGMLK